MYVADKVYNTYVRYRTHPPMVMARKLASPLSLSHSISHLRFPSGHILTCSFNLAILIYCKAIFSTGPMPTKFSVVVAKIRDEKFRMAFLFEITAWLLKLDHVLTDVYHYVNWVRWYIYIQIVAQPQCENMQAKLYIIKFLSENLFIYNIRSCFLFWNSVWRSSLHI